MKYRPYITIALFYIALGCFVKASGYGEQWLPWFVAGVGFTIHTIARLITDSK